MAKFCRNCGATLADADRFCESCGLGVGGGGAMPQTRAVPKVSPTPFPAPIALQSRDSSWIWIVLAVVGVFGFLVVAGTVGAIFYLRRQPAAVAAPLPMPLLPPSPIPDPPPPDPDDPLALPEDLYRVPVGDSPQRGRADALVTIVEFTDFQCPFCGRVQETLARLERERGDRFRLVFKHNPLPFHTNAMPAAEASMAAAAQGKFWEMEARLFANQQALGPADLESHAQAIGLDLSRFRREMDAHVWRPRIEEDQRLATQIGARGTPTFFVNGRVLRGAQPFERFAEMVDREAANASRLVLAGTPASLVYDQVTRSGRTTAETPTPTPTPTPTTPTPDADRIYAIPSNPLAPARGPAFAPVTILEFSDFQCPFCGRARTTVDEIVRTYGSRVRVEFRHYPLPFHQNAQLAAEAAFEANLQGKFWPFHDLLFENQRALERTDLERYATNARLDVRRFRAALDDHRHAAAVQADMDAITRAGAHIGTPSFFINGKLLQGAQPFEAFRGAIDAALAARGR